MRAKYRQNASAFLFTLSLSVFTVIRRLQGHFFFSALSLLFYFYLVKSVFLLTSTIQKEDHRVFFIEVELGTARLALQLFCLLSFCFFPLNGRQFKERHKSVRPQQRHIGRRNLH